MSDLTFGLSFIAVSSILLGLVLFVYFLPTIIAWKRRSEDTILVFFINLLLGWTILGWVAALIYTLAEDKNS